MVSELRYTRIWLQFRFHVRVIAIFDRSLITSPICNILSLPYLHLAWRSAPKLLLERIPRSVDSPLQNLNFTLLVGSLRKYCSSYQFLETHDSFLHCFFLYFYYQGRTLRICAVIYTRGHPVRSAFLSYRYTRQPTFLLAMSSFLLFSYSSMSLLYPIILYSRLCTLK